MADFQIDYSKHPDEGLAFQFINESDIYLHQLNPTIDEQFRTIVETRPSFLAELARRGRIQNVAVYNPYFEWVEHTLAPKTFLVDDLSAAGATTLLLQSTEGLLAQTELSFEASDGSTLDVKVRVVDVVSATEATVERIIMPGLSDIDIPAGAIAHVDAVPMQEKGVENPQCMTKPVKKRNFMQIMKCGFDISRSAMKANIQGLSTEGAVKAGVQSIIDINLDSTFTDLERQLNRSVLYGVGKLRTETVNGTMHGLEYLLREAGAVTPATGALSQDLINDAVNAARLAGGDVAQMGVMLMHSVQARKFSALNPAAGGQRYELGETTTGSYSNRFITDLGDASMLVIVDDNVKKDQIFLLSIDLITVVAGEAFFVKDVSESLLDGKEWQVLGEYSLEVKNAAQQHRLITGLTV